MKIRRGRLPEVLQLLLPNDIRRRPFGTDRHPDRAQSVAAGINANANGADVAMGVGCDVASGDDIQRMVGQVVARWGRIDTLVNNAGVVDRHTNVLGLDEAEWDQFMNITLRSVFLCTKFVARQMVAQGYGGRIINIAATSAHRGRHNATAYQAAKGGVLSLTRALASQLAPYQITVNSITPSRVQKIDDLDAPKVKNLIGRQETAHDIARAAVFLASGDANFITGIDLQVDGGVLASS